MAKGSTTTHGRPEKHDGPHRNRFLRRHAQRSRRAGAGARTRGRRDDPDARLRPAHDPDATRPRDARGERGRDAARPRRPLARRPRRGAAGGAQRIDWRRPEVARRAGGRRHRRVRLRLPDVAGTRRAAAVRAQPARGRAGGGRDRPGELSPERRPAVRARSACSPTPTTRPRRRPPASSPSSSTAR